MGTNTLQTKSPGDIISADDPNQYKTAASEDFVPRNASGVPTDIAGGLGSTLYRWGSSFISRLYLGVAGREVSVTEDSTRFVVQIGTVTKMAVGTAGIDGTYAATGVWPFSIFGNTERPIKRIADYTTAGTSTFVVTSDMCDGTHGVFDILMCGGGGGGGGGGRNSQGQGGGGGGGGGGASMPIYFPLEVILDETLTIIVGAGGDGGTVHGTDGSSGTSGATGGTTSIKRGTVTILACDGGAGGGGGTGKNGTAAAPGGTVSTMTFNLLGINVAGGVGGIGSQNPSGGATDGSVGTTTYFQKTVGAKGPCGGSPGGPSNNEGGGGGGGAASLGNGGAGGVAGGGTGEQPTAGAAATGNGSGGGGGGGSGVQNNQHIGVGGAGSPGLVRIMRVGKA